MSRASNWRAIVLVAALHLPLQVLAAEAGGTSADVTSAESLRAVAKEQEECRSDDLTGLARWFACRRIKVRKSFDSEQDEAKPASAAFESGSSDDYYKIDVGARLKPDTLGENTLWYPVLEFHRSSQTAEQINKKALALKLEYYPFAGDGSGPGLQVPTQASVKPYVLLDGRATRDSVNHQTVGSLEALVSFRSAGPVKFGPGRPHRCGGAALHCFRWRPYLGLEHLNRLAVGPEGNQSDFDGNLGVAKLDLESYPLPGAGYRVLELLVGAEYRNRLSSDIIIPEHSYAWSAELNWYLDKAQSIAIGIDYEDGRSPATNFVSTHRYGLALKFKFTGL